MINLDELERLYREATPGEWRVVESETLEDGSVYPRHILGGPLDNQVCVLESPMIAKGRHEKLGPLYELGQKSISNHALIAALHNAFPALLELARDGERYREAAKGVWVLTREVNAYDQEGEYFVAVFMSKPTAEQLSKHGVPTNRIESVLRNEGRVDNDDDWHFLRFEQDAARKGEK